MAVESHKFMSHELSVTFSLVCSQITIAFVGKHLHQRERDVCIDNLLVRLNFISGDGCSGPLPGLQGYLAHKNPPPPPLGFYRTLGMVRM